MQTEIIKYDGGWRIQFTHGVQTFRLDQYGHTKKQAQWMESMLKLCFKNYKNDILDREQLDEYYSKYDKIPPPQPSSNS